MIVVITYVLSFCLVTGCFCLLLMGIDKLWKRTSTPLTLPGYYKLVDGKVVQCDFIEGVIAFSQDRQIDRTYLGIDLGGKYFVLASQRKGSSEIYVSTVFLGSDHNYRRVGPPLLFETMVFGGPEDGFSSRYCTIKEAKCGHKQIVKCLKEGRYPQPQPS